ncbi:hypothetical protein CCACVL1_22564 [Corchorus capsularis]|uniref:Uncharacterized protein n=1 Tax=Corchorus capsularis TaxID=210143 RepID=A0A1R3GY76_COCAP|nr:hypothetical protein CCACVL1_22564 [Corchorus capsularis]
MGRGVSSGGGQSSLGYLFGSGEAPKPAASGTGTAASEVPPTKNEVAKETPQKSASSSPPAAAAGDATKQIPAGIPGNKANNYYRAEGQNCGNFLTVEP